MIESIESWALTHLKDARVRGHELTAQCPWCFRSDKFSLNLDTGKFNCFHSSCLAPSKVRWFATLVAHVEDIDPREAQRKIPSREGGARAGRRQVKPKANLVEFPLPEEFIACHDPNRVPEWRVIKYLQERNVSREVLSAYGIGFCLSGRYAGRVVIPIQCPNGFAWTARDATGVDSPRYRNPPGRWASLMLGGWQVYKPGQDLVIAEGSFDGLRVASEDLGVGVMWLNGKVLSSEQRALLYRLPADTTIVLMIDPNERRYYTDRIATQLTAGFANLRVGKLEGDSDGKLDLGSATRKQIKSGIDNSLVW